MMRIPPGIPHRADASITQQDFCTGIGPPINRIGEYLPFIRFGKRIAAGTRIRKLERCALLGAVLRFTDDRSRFDFLTLEWNQRVMIIAAIIGASLSVTIPAKIKLDLSNLFEPITFDAHRSTRDDVSALNHSVEASGVHARRQRQFVQFSEVRPRSSGVILSRLQRNSDAMILARGTIERQDVIRRDRWIKVCQLHAGAFAVSSLMIAVAYNSLLCHRIGSSFSGNQTFGASLTPMILWFT